MISFFIIGFILMILAGVYLMICALFGMSGSDFAFYVLGSLFLLFSIWTLAKRPLVESGIVGLVTGVVFNRALHVHPVFCLIIAVAVIAGCYVLTMNSIAFWVRTAIFSLFEAGAGILVVFYQTSDWIWRIFFCIVIIAITIAAHIVARKSIMMGDSAISGIDIIDE